MMHCARTYARMCRTCLRHEMSPLANGWTRKRQHLHTYARRRCKFVCQFSAKNRRRSSPLSSRSITRLEYTEKFILEKKNLVNGDRNGKNCHCRTESRMWPFHWYIYIWLRRILKVKVKVLHTSTVNISETVTDRTSIAIDNCRQWKSCIVFRLVWLQFTIIGPF